MMKKNVRWKHWTFFIDLVYLSFVSIYRSCLICAHRTNAPKKLGFDTFIRIALFIRLGAVHSIGLSVLPNLLELTDGMSQRCS